MLKIRADFYACGPRMVSATSEGTRFTLSVTETNIYKKVIEQPCYYQSYGLKLELRLGVFNKLWFQCRPPDSTFWGAWGTVGDFGHVGTISANPGMSMEYFVSYDMSEDAIALIRKGQLRYLRVAGINLLITPGKLTPHLFTADVKDMGVPNPFHLG